MLTNRFLRHLLPTPPDSNRLGVPPTAEVWNEYAAALDVLAIALGPLNQELRAMARTARERAADATASGSIEANHSTTRAVPEGDPKKDKRQEAHPQSPPAPAARSLLMRERKLGYQRPGTVGPARPS